jgi:hypothetical protein
VSLLNLDHHAIGGSFSGPFVPVRNQFHKHLARFYFRESAVSLSWSDSFLSRLRASIFAQGAGYICVLYR